MELFRTEASEGMWYNEQSLGTASWGPPASCIISLSLTVRIYNGLRCSTQAVGRKGGNGYERSGQRSVYCAILFSLEFGPRTWGRSRIAGWAYQFLAP